MTRNEDTPQSKHHQLWCIRALAPHQRPYIRETMHSALNMRCLSGLPLSQLLGGAQGLRKDYFRWEYRIFQKCYVCIDLLPNTLYRKWMKLSPKKGQCIGLIGVHRLLILFLFFLIQEMLFILEKLLARASLQNPSQRCGYLVM